MRLQVKRRQQGPSRNGWSAVLPDLFVKKLVLESPSVQSVDVDEVMARGTLRAAVGRGGQRWSTATRREERTIWSDEAAEKRGRMDRWMK